MTDTEKDAARFRAFVKAIADDDVIFLDCVDRMLLTLVGQKISEEKIIAAIDKAMRRAT